MSKKTLLICTFFLGVLLFSFFYQKKTSSAPSSLKRQSLCENQYASLRSCPKNVGKVFLPRTYGVKSIYVGYSDDTYHLDFLDLLLEKVETLESKPVVNILIGREDIQNARAYFQPPYTKKQYDYINYLTSPSNEVIWQQDYFEILFDTMTGESLFVDLPYLEREGEHIPAALSLSCQKNLIEQPQNFSEDYPPGNGDYGGNIEPFSEKVLVIGNNITYETSDQIKKITSQELVEIKVDWLLTGHVDELFSVLPHSKNASACDQSLFYASPEKAFELLEKNNEPLALTGPYAQSPFDDGSTWPSFEECLLSKTNPSKKCQNFFLANTAYQKIQRENISLIQEAFQKNHQCKLKEVPIPQLFAPSEEFKEVYGQVDDEALAFNSNSVNNIFFWPYLFLPKQDILPFQKYLVEILKTQSIESIFFEGEFVHTLGGGIHCATNISYACQP